MIDGGEKRRSLKGTISHDAVYQGPHYSSITEDSGLSPQKLDNRGEGEKPSCLDRLSDDRYARKSTFIWGERDCIFEIQEENTQ